MKSNKKTPAIILILLAIIIATIGIYVLPKNVALQIGLSGSKQHIVSKYIAIAIPFVVTMLGAKNYMAEKGEFKSILLMLIGIAAGIFTLVINL